MALFRNYTDAQPADNNQTLIKSIVENLNHVLNTKKGYGSFLADFGIRDMNEYSSRDQLAVAIMHEVRGNIEQYEPRLQILSISIEDNKDPFRISFKIECRLKNTQQALLMEFNSVYNDFRIMNPS